MPADSPPAFTPSKFGRYELVERIAVGGMAEVFKARVQGAYGFEKTLVIKRILPHLAADPEFLSMFIDEAKLQASLAHPKIVQVLEFGEVEGACYIALEYVEGVDALGLLRAAAHRRQKLPVRLAVHIATEVLDALDYAHQKRTADGQPLGVVHRDVSPSNVFISRRGDVKLGDFGIARATAEARSSKTQAGTLKGKYGYMAPEQVVGTPIDGRADIFALGIVLAEMLMGRRLFTAPNDLDVLLMVRDARLERLDLHGGDIPPPLREILNKLLARDAADRPPTAGAARELLLDFLFEARQRVGASDLSIFLDQLLGDPSPVSEVVRSDLLMLGEDTRARRAKAEAERAAMLGAAAQPAAPSVAAAGGTPAAVVATTPVPVEQLPAGGVQLGSTDSGIFIEPASAPAARPPVATPAGDGTPSGEATAPEVRGTFAEVSPARLFTRLASERATGQLIVERGNVTKEIFFVEGTPEFVISNVPSERFGEYLVAQGVISAGELSMALAILPRFHHKLGDTLVGLNLLRPLEVFRHLTRQVRDKLIEVFAWPQGTFRFYPGRTNDREQFPLGLDSFEIVGAAVAGLPLETVLARLRPLSAMRVLRVERARPTPEAFRVGAGPRELWQRLDGKRSVGDWMRRYDQPDQLLTLCRTLYLLIESNLASLEQ